MPSLSARLLKAYSRRTIKCDGLDDHELVAHTRRSMNAPQPQLLPLGVHASNFQLDDYRGSYLSVAEPYYTILYLHGGGFVAGRPETYHNLTSRLAKSLKAQVFIPDYPLAPEHPFPAAVDYCFGLYRHLLQNEKIAPDRLILMGDSAGGGLLFATLLGAKRDGLGMPRCSVALSPAVNIRSDDASIKSNNETDAMLSASMVTQLAAIYADKRHWDNPLASPVDGDFSGTTPVMITSCREECLYDSNKLMASRLRHQGVKVRWLERFDLLHVWPILVPWMKEAREDLVKIVAFIRQPEHH